VISRDTSKESARVVTQIYRSMPAGKKIKLIFDAMQMGQQLAMAGLRRRYPDANNDQVWHLWARQHLGEELYQQAYGDENV